ncbi:MAG: hypothetical protein ABI954_00120 [Pyrinomonadaceae bacterium]
MTPQNTKFSWICGAFVGVFLLTIGLYPQISLWHTRGANYQGIYAYNDLDETAYAGYLQALIEGRPRRNNPFTGVDHQQKKPLPESLFSIQFLAPYMIAIPAKILGVDASSALIWVSALAALAAALAIYKLTLSLTEDALFAATTTLVVLCCGVLAIGEGAISEICYGWAAYPYFPFLRRYVPAVPFPIFWLFCLTVWRLLTNENARIRVIYTVLAWLCFAALIYSYFYIWTTAAAWLACLGVVWLVSRPENWRRDVQALIILGLLGMVSLVPYALMLANRDTAMDSVQLLVHTRTLDLLRHPEILSLTSLLILSLSLWQGFISLQNKLTLFVISLALVPIVVFNQQVLTGHVLQPVHYEVFIINYVALFSFCLTIFLLWRGTEQNLPKSSRLALIAIALTACVWGTVEARYTTAVVSEANALRDEAKPVGNRLRELAKTELFDEDGNRAIVLPLSLLQGDDEPALAPQGVLWARHQHVFTGETVEENKERFYHFMYFSGLNGELLRQQLRSNNVIVVISLFGWDRLNGRLSIKSTPLTEDEIQTESQKFESFRQNFNQAQAARRRISYVIVQNGIGYNFTNLDRWYDRDEGEIIGNYVLYKVKLK